MINYEKLNKFQYEAVMHDLYDAYEIKYQS